MTLLNQPGFTPDGNALAHRLARLELGFVLGRDERGNYFDRVPLFREFIGQDAPAVKLQVELANRR